MAMSHVNKQTCDSLFTQKLVNTDVICVKKIKEFVLAGIGSCLHVYKNLELVYKVRIFYGQRIHGMTREEDTEDGEHLIVFFGGKYIAVCKFLPGPVITFINTWTTNDWVHAAVILQEQPRLAVVTAHNLIEVWDWKSKKREKVYGCEEKCILYCCYLLGKSVDELLLLSGTVFCEVVIWAPSSEGDSRVLQRLKGHDGVIFSIVTNEDNTKICTTSDDRSVRIWTVIHTNSSTCTATRWNKALIVQTYCLYGHTARVWRSMFNDNNLASIGEDGIICLWSSNGKLLKQWSMYQNCAIWSLDWSDELITGDSTGAVTSWPVQRVFNSQAGATLYSVTGVPRRLVEVRSKDEVRTVVVTDGALFVSQKTELFTKYCDSRLSNYCLINISPCHGYVALCSIEGHVIILETKQFTVVKDEKLIDGRIFSFHWLVDECLVCAQNGVLHTFNSQTLEQTNEFVLPSSKERWTNCALKYKNAYLVGDRMGSLFLYINKREPEQKFRRIHGYLGTCDIILFNNLILTTGRDGTIKKFKYVDGVLLYLQNISLPFSWGCKMVISNYGLLVYGFRDKTFVIWSEQTQGILFSANCGGGHRFWDCVINDKTATFAYIKNKQVHAVEYILEDEKPKYLRTWFHSREVNCMKNIENNKEMLLISGGEDNLVKLWKFRHSLELFHVIHTHKSSVKCIETCAVTDKDHVIFTGGGRAQIIVSKLVDDDLYDVTQHELSSTDSPETRYMDLSCVLLTNRDILLLAGCSDGFLRIFNYNCDEQALCLKSMTCLNFCVLKVYCLQHEDELYALVLTTDGYISFFSVKNEPLLLTKLKIHQSGINSFDIVQLDKADEYIVVTGGDDNAVCLHLFVMKDVVVMKSSWTNSNIHSCQITGTKFYNNHIVTTSIDQRISLLQWSVSDGTVNATLVDQYICDIPDVHGLLLLPDQPDGNNVQICVYGEGYEFVNLSQR